MQDLQADDLIALETDNDIIFHFCLPDGRQIGCADFLVPADQR